MARRTAKRNNDAKKTKQKYPKTFGAPGLSQSDLYLWPPHNVTWVSGLMPEATSTERQGLFGKHLQRERPRTTLQEGCGTLCSSKARIFNLKGYLGHLT